MTPPRLLAMSLSALLGALFGACDLPECIDGPSNLTPENTAGCLVPNNPIEPRIVSAGAELLDDGSLVLTWTSFGMECGTRATDVELATDCERTGWSITAELPPELVVPGTIDLAAHPEVLGALTVLDSSGGGSRPAELVGQLELTQISDDCVTGVLHGFGTGLPDPSFGGPELAGSFVAPAC
jgi:hypothetical protein